MTKEPLNIKSVLDEFDRNIERYEYVSEETREELRIILATSLRQAMEVVKPEEIESIDLEYNEDTANHGWNNALYELNQNITAFFDIDK